MEEYRACPFCKGTRAEPAYKVDEYVIIKCCACKLVYLANPASEETLYDSYYTDLEIDPNDYRINSNNKSLAELCSINMQRISELKKLSPEGTLLDIGCGRGFFLKTANEAGYEVKGIDIAQNAVEFAANILHMQADSFTISELNKRKHQYHIITLWHVLEHFSDPLYALQIIRDLLVKDGICIIEVPNLQSLKFTLSMKKWSGGNHPKYHRTFFTASTLRQVLETGGFSHIVRLKLSYNIPGRSFLYQGIKKSLNLIARDAFLIYAAWK
jgi:2-polyprenyl-3-methyl-5-hydroxy-6-metoxy-1,4-benzoquinol methylase